MNYYPHHLGDYDGATAHLSWDEDMAYSRLLRAYYRREKPIPADPGETYRLVRAITPAQKKAVSTVLEEFFYEGDDGWHNKRADEEIAKAVGKGMRAKVSAGKRWHPEKDAKAMPTHSEGNAKAMLEPDAKAMLPRTNSQEPIAKNQEKTKEEVALRLPEWLPSEEWKAWLEVRRGLKCKNTPRALMLALTELERLKSLGHDPAKVLDQSTLKSWKSVFPLKLELVTATAEPAAQLCDYCAKVSTGKVNGRRSCDEHFERAMDNEKPARIAA